MVDGRAVQKKKKPAEEVLKHSFASLSSVSFSLLQ